MNAIARLLRSSMASASYTETKPSAARPASTSFRSFETCGVSFFFVAGRSRETQQPSLTLRYQASDLYSARTERAHTNAHI